MVWTITPSLTWNESVWNPSMVGGLTMWLDAADTATITQSSSLVSQISDKSGAGRNFTASGSQRPTLASNTLNGKSVLSYSSGNFLTSTNTASSWNFLHDGTEYMLFFVTQLSNSSEPNASLSVINTSDGQTAVSGVAFSYDDRSFLPRNNCINFVISKNASPYLAQVLVQDVWIPDSPQIVCAACKPASVTAGQRIIASLNGGTSYQSSDSGSPSNANAFKTATLGEGIVGGYIAEVIVYATSPSQVIQQKTEGYLARKWGLTAKLPSNHPYKTVGPVP